MYSENLAALPNVVVVDNKWVDERLKSMQE
jgi:hypothetical protein